HEQLVEALVGQDRHPPTTAPWSSSAMIKKAWREVFGISQTGSADVGTLYREKARNRHPDAGGSDTLMAELNVAFTEAKRALGLPPEASLTRRVASSPSSSFDR